VPKTELTDVLAEVGRHGETTLVASVARIANLGSFSMWLDEILETTIASSSITSLYASLVRDAVHPPLEGQDLGQVGLVGGTCPG
jgi:hypothetical protein